jgi:Mn2+/Fe2+ NRAMP family transporter
MLQYLILAATAFYKNGLFEVAEIQDAYKLLDNIFGSVAPTLFAIALIASGQSSTITGTLSRANRNGGSPESTDTALDQDDC